MTTRICVSPARVRLWEEHVRKGGKLEDGPRDGPVVIDRAGVPSTATGVVIHGPSKLIFSGARWPFPSGETPALFIQTESRVHGIRERPAARKER